MPHRVRDNTRRDTSMSATLLIPPSAEPWTLAEAKDFLRVEHDDDDAVIAALIAAARGHVEALSRRALLVQRWRFVLDAWPAGGRLDPRMGPLRSVIAARVFDAAGNAHSIDAGTFVIDAAANIIASPCWAVPLPGRFSAGIELDVELGYGALASDVTALPDGGAPQDLVIDVELVQIVPTPRPPRAPASAAEPGKSASQTSSGELSQSMAQVPSVSRCRSMIALTISALLSK